MPLMNSTLAVESWANSVQILAQDEGSKTSDTVNAAQILVNQQQVNFMLGPYFSGDVKAVLPITTSGKVVQILTVSSLELR